MLGQITKAIIDEIKALLSGTGATVLLKTNFLTKKMPDNPGNFVLLDIDAAPDSVQYPGGLSRVDYNWSLGSYNYQPDAYNDDETDYSTSLMNFIDTIRQHFSVCLPGALPISGDTNLWLTQGMTDIFNTYGFFFTLSGITIADAIEQEGLMFGFKIGFFSTAFDNTTMFTENDIVLRTVTQIIDQPIS